MKMKTWKEELLLICNRKALHGTCKTSCDQCKVQIALNHLDALAPTTERLTATVKEAIK